jgi:hypothetical protein
MGKRHLFVKTLYHTEKGEPRGKTIDSRAFVLYIQFVFLGMLNSDDFEAFIIIP